MSVSLLSHVKGENGPLLFQMHQGLSPDEGSYMNGTCSF